jgi:type IV secretion system protein TrbI
VDAEAALAAVSATGAPGAPGPTSSTDRRWGRQQRFMQDLGAATSEGATRAELEPSPGPYALQAGTMIPAVLLTEISSDLPGNVLAQVAHDVFDSRDQRALLIPKGARLVGTYDSDVSSNQRRLFVAWTRMILPDGRSLALPNLETKDRSGAGGVADRVDQHRRRTFGTAALLSLVGAGAQLAQPNGGYGALGAYPSAGQIAAGAAGQQLAQVATEMLRKQMDVQPTIRIRQGMPFQVFLRTDIVFPGPYRAEPSR